MNQVSIRQFWQQTKINPRYGLFLRCFFAGLLLPLGFAPFHLSGLAILGIALLFAQLNQSSPQNGKEAFWFGFIFGWGFLGFGVSWIYVSIHLFGHLNMAVSAMITCLFISYLALFFGLIIFLYHRFAKYCSSLSACFLFSILWCLGEYLRATCLGGFPWLLLGFAQIDTPLKYLLPVIGVHGVSFVACFAATLLATAMQSKNRWVWLFAFVLLLLAPTVLKQVEWTTAQSKSFSVAVAQANVSMHDKWDETKFWQLLEQYRNYIKPQLGKKQLIVLPESAIPVPARYISDIMNDLDQQAKQAGSAILFGIPQATATDSNNYYNTVSTLGLATGHYNKQHLVLFGEYIPAIFDPVIRWLQLPNGNLMAGPADQSLIQVHGHPIASLVCYELAYPHLLRRQLPMAEWIVSISDDGWFGHSLAMYQHLQMAQALSQQTGRFQIVANNDGLSALLNQHGEIVNQLPAFTAGVLSATVFPYYGSTPWVLYGDLPLLACCIAFIIIFGFALLREVNKNAALPSPHHPSDVIE